MMKKLVTKLRTCAKGATFKQYPRGRMLSTQFESAVTRDKESLVPGQTIAFERRVDSNTINKEYEWMKFADNDVMFVDMKDVGVIQLNRAKSLNALTYSMITKIIPVLKKWETKKKIIIIESTSDKVFCSGGDLTLVGHISNPDSTRILAKFLSALYTLQHVVGGLKTPCISLIDNLTMGAGAGLSVNSRFAVATERTVFAMPEAAISLCPDTGATYFLPRLPHKLGYYLGLTGQTLKGFDVHHVGLASHYVPSERMMELKEDLINLKTSVPDILHRHQQGLVHKKFTLEPYLEKIDHCFSPDTLEETIERLNKDGSEWAMKTMKKLNALSPVVLKVAKRAFDKGLTMTLDDCLMMEFKLNLNFLRDHKSDVMEGIGVALHKKNAKPNWERKVLNQVTEDSINKCFFDNQDPQLKLIF